MATAKQIEANRRNASRSTGPRTAEGKAASRFNALNHGLRASQLALPHESNEEVQAFVDAIIEAVSPRDAMEAELACEIATLSWKLRRAERYEHAVLSKRLHAKVDGLAGQDEEETAWNIEIAAFDDEPDGHRRRRYINTLRNSLARARKELRLWQEFHPEPEPLEDQPDTAEIGFVRQGDVLGASGEPVSSSTGSPGTTEPQTASAGRSSPDAAPSVIEGDHITGSPDPFTGAEVDGSGDPVSRSGVSEVGAASGEARPAQNRVQ